MLYNQERAFGTWMLYQTFSPLSFRTSICNQDRPQHLDMALNFKHIEGQLARWIEVLAQYNMIIQHRSGKSMSTLTACPVFLMSQKPTKITNQVQGCVTYLMEDLTFAHELGNNGKHLRKMSGFFSTHKPKNNRERNQQQRMGTKLHFIRFTGRTTERSRYPKASQLHQKHLMSLAKLNYN